MGLDQQKIIRTFRLSFTCLFLFLITWYYQVPESAWCLITIWFVMFEYSTIGGVFTKSFFRFSGTVLSAIYGMVIVYFCDNNPLVNMIALVPGLFVYSYYFMGGEKTYIGTIGAVTLTIVLLNYNDVDTAIVRVFNIILGIVGSMIMIRFFYPQYARDRVIETLGDFLEEFSLIIEDYREPSKSLTVIKEQYLVHDHLILEHITSFQRLVTEAKIETKKTPQFVVHNRKALEHIRHIFRLLSVFIFYVTTEDIRSNLRINAHLNQLLLDLRTMQRMLNGESKRGIKKPKSRNIIVKPPKTNMQFIEVMLTNMNNEMLLLEDEIKKILLSYNVYGARHHWDLENIICE